MDPAVKSERVVHHGAVRLGDLITLVRPAQWPKNVLVLAPVPLHLSMLTAPSVMRLAWAVVAFVLASSLVYVVNDLVDRHHDRLHPVKRKRPISAGRVSVPAAVGYAVVLAAMLTAVVAVQPPIAGWWPVGAYLAVNVGYSLGLKHVAPFDIFIVALGFVLRILQGSLAVGERPPDLLLTCVLCVCLLLSIGKRRTELLTVGVAHRPALARYTVPLLDVMLLLTAVVAIASFLMFLQFETKAPSTGGSLLIPVAGALLAILRYLQILMVDRGGGDPVATLLRDRLLASLALASAGLLILVHALPPIG